MVHEEYAYLSGELQRKEKNGLPGVRGSRWRHIGLCNRLIVAAPCRYSRRVHFHGVEFSVMRRRGL
jgi:hypothetical protein